METTTIQAKILAVQAMLKAPKDKYNSFGKYSYRSAEGILEAVKPLLKEQGLMLYLTDDILLIGGRFYVKATASVTDGETVIAVTSYAREDQDKKGMDGSQITGTASSYARKYALNGLFLIDDTKDADTDEYQQQTGRQTPQVDIDAYIREIDGLMTGEMLNEWWRNCNKDIPADIKERIFQECKRRGAELKAKEDR